MSTPLNPHSLGLIFTGTAEFAATHLRALLDSEQHILAVYTQPDRPAGRGQRLQASPVKQLALQYNLPIYQPNTLRDPLEQETLRQLNAELMIVVAYGLLIPAKVLAMPRFGCINVHGSLLPRWRGAAPIQRAILANDTLTGISIMQMERGLDTGPVLWQESCKINPHITSGELHDQLANIGATALLSVLPQLQQLQSKQKAQDASQATYASKIHKQEALINWHLSAQHIHNQVRAFNPWPIAYTHLHQQVLRIWRTEMLNNVMAHSVPPGTIITSNAEGIDVATGNGQLRLCVMQAPGGKPISAQDFVNAQHKNIHLGKTVLGTH